MNPIAEKPTREQTCKTEVAIGSATGLKRAGASSSAELYDPLFPKRKSQRKMPWTGEFVPSTARATMKVESSTQASVALREYMKEKDLKAIPFNEDPVEDTE